MNNIFLLFKNELAKSFSKTSFKENKVKSTSYITILSLVVIFGVLISSLYSYMYGRFFCEAGQEPFPITLLFASAATMITFYSGITQTRGIFLGNDHDLLCSLPLKKKDIITAKLLNLYIVELIYSGILLLPNGIVNLILTGSLKYVIVSIVLTLFISAFPLIVSMLFSFISALVASKFRHGTVISLIMYAILFAGIFFISFSLNSAKSAEEQANLVAGVSDVIKWINPTVWFVEMSLVDNIVYLLPFVAINIASLVLVILVFALFYDKIYDVVNSFKSDFKYERKKLKSKKQLKAMLWLEFKRLFSSKIYMVNSFVGIIFCILMSGFLAVIFSKYSPFNPSEELLKIILQYSFMGSMVVVFSLSIYNPTAVAISIEGKNFWLTKSLPINYKKYMWSKILISLVLYIPTSLISSTIIVVLLMPSWIDILAIYIIPLYIVTLEVFISLLINIYNYKLKWTNEQEVVKNSSSVVFTMLIGFLIEILTIGLLIGLSFVSKILAILLTIAVLFTACIIFYIILNNKFEKQILRIEGF